MKTEFTDITDNTPNLIKRYASEIGILKGVPKTEQQLLKEICDIIGYEIKTNYIGFLKDNEIGFAEGYFRATHKKINVREIIFTEEFMDKFINYRANWNLKPDPLESLIGTFYKNLLGSIDREGNLNNPVSYLATILNIKQD